MIDVAVIADPAAAEAALEPARARLLAQLTEPRSAAMLAAAVGLPRQKVNYHLRTLERHGLVELVEERRKGNVTERLLRAAAASYVISPSALAAVAPDPARAPDRLSAGWLLALAAQLVRDVGDLITGAARAQKKLATFAMDGRVRFASATDRAAFTSELVAAVTSLTAAREWMEKAYANAIAFLRSKSAEDLAQPLPAGPIMGGQPISDIVWAMVEHTAHHRGALTVYSRLLGKVPPMPYGG